MEATIVMCYLEFRVQVLGQGALVSRRMFKPIFILERHARNPKPSLFKRVEYEQDSWEPRALTPTRVLGPTSTILTPSACVKELRVQSVTRLRVLGLGAHMQN